MSTTTTPIDIAYVADTLLATMKKGGLKAETEHIWGFAVVEGTHANSSVLRYIIGPKSIKGPNSEDHSEHNGFNAVIHNIDEDLSVLGLTYNPRNRRYVGNFSKF